MKTILFFIIFNMFMNALHSQTKFFISPVINQKVFITTAPAFKNYGVFYNSTTLASNPYFNYKIKKFSTRLDIPMGLNFGVSFLGDKHILSLGYTQDGVGNSKEISYFSKSLSLPNDPYTNVFTDFTYPKNNLFYINRLTVKYSYRLNKNIEEKNKIYLNTDFSIIYGKSFIQSQTSFPDPQIILLHNNAQITEFRAGTIYDGKANYMIGFGLMFDYGFKIKNKWRYILSLEVNYRHGLKAILYNNEIFKIEDKDETFYLIYGSQSRGSGIYFEISRRFQFYPKKIKHCLKTKSFI